MQLNRLAIGLAFTALAALGTATSGANPSGDFDGDGYVGVGTEEKLGDYFYFEICFSISGPGHDPGYDVCVDTFDADGDGDVDLADFAAFQRAARAPAHAPQGHPGECDHDQFNQTLQPAVYVR